MSARVIPHDDLMSNVIDVEARPKDEAAALKKVLEFLEELALEKEEGDVVVELQQQSRGTMPGQAIQAWEIRAEDDLQETAQQIIDEAVKDGREGGSGKIRYAIVAKGRRGRRSFVLTFPDLGDEGLDEYPNEKGALALAMSMLKDMHKTVLDLVHDSTRSHKGIIVEQGMQLRKHIEVATKNFEMMGDLYSAHHERQVSLLKTERGEKRMDEVAGFLMTTGQIVFNTFMGKKVFEKAPTPIEHLTYATMSMFTQEQATAIQTGQPITLRQDQAVGLFKLFEALATHYETQRSDQKQQEQPYHPASGPLSVGANPPAYVTVNGPPPNGAATDYANGAAGGDHHPAADAVT
jgi:hypothetical protein